jgi:O-antigen biosynthesis alpha-1,4-mannosyltransferase
MSGARITRLKPRISQPFVVNASRVGRKGGLNTFTIALLQCLASLDSTIEVVLPEGVPVPGQLIASKVPGWLASSSRVSKLRPILWLFYCAFFFPARRGCRILSTTHHALPFRRNQILTVHDLRPLHEPDSWVQSFYFRYMLPRTLHKCDGIITVSQTSKRELVNIFRLPDRKIHVVPNAISIDNRPPDSHVRSNRDYPPFLLMVGASWQHKNAMELLESHKLWADRYQLKLVAGKGQYLDRLKRRAAELNIHTQIEFIENVSDINLQHLYMECSALVYPSRIEGFGLPPLEAMTYRKPVIVSDIPVFHELFEEVPLYVQLGRPESWAAAFRELHEIEADENHWRRSAGLHVARSYSIERMQTALFTALREIWKC